MSAGKYEKPSARRFLWNLLIAVATVAVLLLILDLKSCGNMPGSNSDNTATVEKNPDSIAIPGYEMLELKAGSKEQSLRLSNPPQNCCYFLISLCLEDGTLLWRSELIEPGKTSQPILLTMALEKGMYPNAVLRYSCFSQDEDMSPLNGAETKVTLWVK